MSFYEVKVVTRAGVVLAVFDASVGGDARQKATVQSITWMLNEPGSLTFSAPIHHPAALEVQLLTREVQVWRNGALIFWGVPVQREATGGVVTWTCPGLLWYFTRLYFGPVSANYITNGLFATDLSSWTAVGCTATRSTAIRLRGPGTAKLVSAAYGDNYLEQSIPLTVGPDFGFGFSIAAWFYIESMTDTAFGERGLYVQCNDGFPNADPDWEPITFSTEGGFQRVEIYQEVKPAVTTTVKVRLYSPVGTIYWGAVTAYSPESVGALNNLPEEAATVIGKIIDYAQHGANKSELNILWSTPATGLVERVSYQFSEMANIFDALRGYAERGVCDFEIALTSTTRTFTTYAPRKGSYKAAYGITVPGSGAVSVTHRLDGQQTASHVTRRGAGSGPDREFGLAIDTSNTGGIILQDVEDAPTEVNIDGLDAYAAADLGRLKSTVKLPQVTVRGSDWIGNVVVGDTVPVTIDWGAVQETTTQRVVSLTLDGQSDLVSVGFNTP